MTAVIAGLGKDIELRHQRNPDVIFDGMRKRQNGYGAPTRMQPQDTSVYNPSALLHQSA